MLRALAPRWEMNVGFWDLCVATLESDDSYHSFPGSGSKWVSSGCGFCLLAGIFIGGEPRQRSSVALMCQTEGFFDASAGTVRLMAFGRGLETCGRWRSNRGDVWTTDRRVTCKADPSDVSRSLAARTAARVLSQGSLSRFLASSHGGS